MSIWTKELQTHYERANETESKYDAHTIPIRVDDAHSTVIR